MSEKIIPEHIDPFRYADQSLNLEGSVNLADFPRLSQNLADQAGEVAVTLAFGKDEQKNTIIKGTLNTVLNLQCQRCMEPFRYEIMSNFILGVVKSLEEVNDLPENYEPAMAVDNNLAIKDLIEDEIILNLPIIPKHDLDECQVKLPLQDKNWEQGERDNPFRVLETLKPKQKEK